MNQRLKERQQRDYSHYSTFTFILIVFLSISFLLLPLLSSQPTPVIPRGYPETEYDVSYFKRTGLKLRSLEHLAADTQATKREHTSAKRLRMLPATAPQVLREKLEKEADVEWLEQPPQTNASGVKELPHHIPQPTWHHDYEQLKRMRRFYLETGVQLPGCPRKGLSTTKSSYYPAEKLQSREEWDQVVTIRDIRIPRLQ